MKPSPTRVASRFAGRMDRQMYDQGREDSFAGIRPQIADKDYMMGYNEAQEDAGLPRLQPPSGGRGKRLNPDLLKGALPGKRWKRR